jgi:hypothetical protein
MGQFSRAKPGQFWRALQLAVVKDARIRHVLRPAVARQGHADSLPRDQATTASSDARSTPQHQPDNDSVRVADFGRHCS